MKLILNYIYIMHLKKIYESLNFTPRLKTNAPVISSVDDGYEKNEEGEYISTLKLNDFFLNLLESKRYKKNLIYVYDMNIKEEYNNTDINNINDWTWYEPCDLMVRSWILYTKLSQDKQIIPVKWWKYYIKEINIEEFKNLTKYQEVNFWTYSEIMYLEHFYLHINDDIIIYGHIDYSFWFIDITWKNWELMRELLRDFVKIKWLTWYANELWKDYIESNDIRINVS